MDASCKFTLITFLILTCNTVYNSGQNYDGDFEDYEDIDFPSSNGYSDNALKRFSKFVRIGRGLSSFIRIGRQVPYNEIDLYEPANSPDVIANEISDTGKSAFFKMQPETFEQPAKKLSSFVRIGKTYGNDENRDKRGGAFIRMGKFPSSAFLRNRGGKAEGYTAQPYYRRTGRIGHSSFIRIGKRDTSDALRRMSENANMQDDTAMHLQNADSDNDIDSIFNDHERRYLKIGRDIEGKSNDNSGDKGKRYLKIGRDIVNGTEAVAAGGQTFSETEKERTNDGLDKRLSNFVRIGRESSSTIDWPGELQRKRFSKFVRIGKNNNNMLNKRRVSSFVRIGRQKDQGDSFAKRRISSFVRIGKKSSDFNADEAQTTLLTGRYEPNESSDDDFGKRISSFVRIGKSSSEIDDDINKRYSSFVRIGRNEKGTGNELSKRYSSFVRIGRNYPHQQDEYNKRLSSFIRVGKNYEGNDKENFKKRISSFVRIGKNSPSFVDSPDKRYSSFVRIGKGGTDFDPINQKRLSSFIRVGKGITDTSLDKYSN